MAELYVADQLHHPPPPNPPLGGGEIIVVTAAPSADVGNDGDLAINSNTGDTYTKYGGVWTLTGAGGSSGGGLAGDGEPTATYPSGPPSGAEGTPYVNRLTGQIFWWYSGQWN